LLSLSYFFPKAIQKIETTYRGERLRLRENPRHAVVLRQSDIRSEQRLSVFIRRLLRSLGRLLEPAFERTFDDDAGDDLRQICQLIFEPIAVPLLESHDRGVRIRLRLALDGDLPFVAADRVIAVAVGMSAKCDPRRVNLPERVRVVANSGKVERLLLGGVDGDRERAGVGCRWLVAHFLFLLLNAVFSRHGVFPCPGFTRLCSPAALATFRTVVGEIPSEAAIAL